MKSQMLNAHPRLELAVHPPLLQHHPLHHLKMTMDLRLQLRRNRRPQHQHHHNLRPHRRYPIKHQKPRHLDHHRSLQSEYEALHHHNHHNAPEVDLLQVTEEPTTVGYLNNHHNQPPVYPLEVRLHHKPWHHHEQ